MNERGAKTYGGVTVAPFGEVGDVRTNLMPAELADLEALAGDLDVETALVIGAELEPMTIAVHTVFGARETAGVGAFGSWHEPFGEPITTNARLAVELPMFEVTTADPAQLGPVVSDVFGPSSIDLVVDMGTSTVSRSGAFHRLLPKMSARSRYLLRRTTPSDTVVRDRLVELDRADVLARVPEMPSYDVAAVSHEASLALADATSPISRLSMGRSWVAIDMAVSPKRH